MNDIEELLRETLHAMPAASTRVADPLPLIEKRVRRLRLMFSGGVVVAALMITMAVFIPAQLNGSGANTQRVQVTHSASPTPSPVRSAHAGQPTVWESSGVLQMTSAGGWIWVLEQNPSSNSGAMYVVKVNPQTHQSVDKWDVQAPATWLAVVGNYAWVWGGGDGAYPDGVVQAVDTTQQDHVVAFTLKGQAFDGLQPTSDSGRDVAVLAGSRVMQLVASSGGLSESASLQLDEPALTNQNAMATTGVGDIWVATTRHLVEIGFFGGPSAQGQPRMMSSQPKDSVSFSSSIYGPAGKDAIWTYDGDRLVALSPALLHAGVSVAEGARISLYGLPMAVAPDGKGGLFVSVSDSANMGNGTSAGVADGFVGLVDVPASVVRDGGNYQTSWSHLDGVTPFGTLAPDGAGGVNYINNDGGASYWHPTS
jgi:hypothetical protein